MFNHTILGLVKTRLQFYIDHVDVSRCTVTTRAENESAFGF